MTAPHQLRRQAATPLDGRELAIARSVLYASLFDYPLSLAQLRQTLLESVMTPTDIVRTYEGSEALQAVVERRDGFFFPAGRFDLVHERRCREARSHAFLARHKAFLTVVGSLPYVRMIALSGSIAHLNMDGAGDLDLFIVTRTRRVWSTTVAVILLAKAFRCRPSVCANFVLAENRLTLSQPDLFTASQIIHLKPLVGEDLFARLVGANPFVGRYYPNFHSALARYGGPHIRSIPAWFRSALEWSAMLPSAVVERVCRAGYRRYLLTQTSRWQTPDQVRLDDECLKLHTQSHRQTVLGRFARVVGEAVSGPTPRGVPS